MPQQAQVLLAALQLIDRGVLAGEADAAPDPARIRPRCRSSVELLAVRSPQRFTDVPLGVGALLVGAGARLGGAAVSGPGAAGGAEDARPGDPGLDPIRGSGGRCGRQPGVLAVAQPRPVAWPRAGRR